jgi:hypothetical protein
MTAAFLEYSRRNKKSSKNALMSSAGEDIQI